MGPSGKFSCSASIKYKKRDHYCCLILRLLTSKLPMLLLAPHGGSSVRKPTRRSEFSSLVALNVIVSNDREGDKPENV
jgi:hypothetical protein